MGPHVIFSYSTKQFYQVLIRWLIRAGPHVSGSTHCQTCVRVCVPDGEFSERRRRAEPVALATKRGSPGCQTDKREASRRGCLRLKLGAAETAPVAMEGGDHGGASDNRHWRARGEEGKGRGGPEAHSGSGRVLDGAGGCWGRADRRRG